MQKESSEIFGKYSLLDRIAVGGMAEVYRGKLTGEKGFEKAIVIKKMLPQVAADPEMVQHFIDEARLAALLQHENIIHIYDFGELDGSYFIAMEYLNGQDLNTILNKARQKEKPMDLEIILWITSKICDGLAYAHGLKSLDGEPLQLIHRDISPHNIFLTYDGKVKILDFGIAKTTIQSRKTQSGIAKGKLAYMSPEQVEGMHIDHRSDIFAIGILLYEMITGRKMYTGDMASLFKQVMNADYTPPEIHKPELSTKLISILDHALQKDPDMRFQSCLELQTEIDDCIFSLSLRPSAKKIADYIGSLFEDDSLECSETSIGKDQIPHLNDTGLKKAGTELGDDETQVMEPGSMTMEMTSGTRFAHESTIHATLSSRISSILNRFKSKTKVTVISSVIVLLLVMTLSVTSYYFMVSRVHDEVKSGYVSETKGNPKSEEDEISKQRLKRELELLNKAEECIKKGELTTPKGDCAFYYYSEIQKLNPNSEEAEKGFTKIAMKYGDLCEKALADFKIDEARYYVAKGLKIRPNNPRLLKLKKEANRSKPDIILNNIGKGVRDLFK